MFRTLINQFKSPPNRFSIYTNVLCVHGAAAFAYVIAFGAVHASEPELDPCNPRRLSRSMPVPQVGFFGLWFAGFTWPLFYTVGPLAFGAAKLYNHRKHKHASNRGRPYHRGPV